MYRVSLKCIDRGAFIFNLRLKFKKKCVLLSNIFNKVIMSRTQNDV